MSPRNSHRLALVAGVMLSAVAALPVRIVAQTPRTVVDAQTRWEFIMPGEASVDSPIIRLGDVLRPLERDLAAWPRLASATVGLMPIDGGAAKLSRDRLADLLARAQATPEKITIHGPETIVVVRQAGAREPADPTSTPVTDSPAVSAAIPVRVASYRTPTGAPGVAPEVLDSATLARVQTFVQLWLRQEHRELIDSFEIEASADAATVGTLAQLQGIHQLRFLDRPPVWNAAMATEAAPQVVRISIEGRGMGTPCDGHLQLTLVPHPPMIAATRSMARGTRVTAGDVIVMASRQTREEALTSPVEPDAVIALDEVIGQEVVSVVREGVPLVRSQFMAPRLIRRGELVEVMVSGGGVRVTTAAKSLSEGAAGELIEVETLQPRRRLLARVVAPSLVEVITQPHR